MREKNRALWILDSFSSDEKNEFLTNFSSTIFHLDVDCFNWWLSQGLSLESELSKTIIEKAAEDGDWDNIEIW